MTLDRERLVHIASREPLAHAQRVFGPPGAEALVTLVAVLRGVYEYVAPEQLTGGLTIVRAVNVGDPTGPLPDHFPRGAQDLAAPRQLAELRLVSITIIILPNGYLRLAESEPDPRSLAPGSVVYRFDPVQGEYFLIGDQDVVRPERVEDFLSAYAIPTFFSLDAALADYARRRARYGQYGDLKRAWRDGCRLMFLPKPERHMRRSLEEYLDVSLRDVADVLPEQNVDEEHPIDIRVTFSHTNRVALIEIKWLGKSAPPDQETVTEYSASRARTGAKQLADYLDAHYVRARGKILLGYLVVFDARRRNVNATTTEITREDGLHYEHSEINYDASIVDRDDFALPLRMFMEPVCA